MKADLKNAAEPLSSWQDIDRLYARLLSALYEKHDRAAARKLAPRLRLQIASRDPSCTTVLGAAARSVLAELDGDWWSAISARKREIDLLKRLLNSNLPAEAGATHEDISDRMDLLASLYWESGDLDQAEQTLLKSQQYCAINGIQFDGASMLRELRKERRAAARANAAIKKRAS